jgi:MinD superfamily P-loop ATPase
MTVISGKGGTGKTTVTAALASLLPEELVLADCDVDAADMHLLLQPQIREVEDFVGSVAASVDPDRCVACGLCGERCHFGALAPVEGPDGGPSHWAVDELACEGCGLCALVCPEEAVALEEQVTGQSFVSETRFGPMAHARLGVGAENSGKLVTHVRRLARELAPGRDRILGDGSPGTSCPVIASISGVDAALIVTEPTVSGVHDLGRVLELTAHFGVPSLICINKCDLNKEQCRRIEQMAERAGAPVVGRVPFDDQVNRAVRQGRVITECGDGEAAGAIREMADRLQRRLTRLEAGS